MLERHRFAIQECNRVRSSIRSFDIRDADAGEIVGTAIEKLGFLTRRLRWMLPRRLRPTFVEVREKPDDSLVFTLRRGWPLLGSSIEIHDSHDQLVGTIRGRFRVFDKAENCFAHTVGSEPKFDFKFLAEHDSSSLGTVSKNGDVTDGCTLEASPDLAELPLSKMLLLAATLAVGIVHNS